MADEHPLFPAAPEEDAEDYPDITTIFITRHNPTKGPANDPRAYDWFPRPFPADELASLEQIAQMFGGGSYDLVARGPMTQPSGKTKDVVRRHQRYDLAGAPRPFVAAEEVPKTPQVPVLPPAAGVAAASDLVQLMAAMMQSQTALVTAVLSQSQQVMLAMMTRSGEDARAHVQTMAQQHATHTENMARLMQAFTTAGTSATDPEKLLSLIREGIGIGKQTTGGGEESSVGDLLQGMAAIAGLANAEGAPAGQSPIPVPGVDVPHAA